MPLTTYEAQSLLGKLFGSGAPATIYVALFNTTPTNLGGGTEVATGSYARVGVTNNNTNWTGPSATWPSISSNAFSITFPAATADWGVVGWFGLYDAPTGGNLLWWGTLSTSVDVPSGSTYVFTSGNLQMTLG